VPLRIIADDLWARVKGGQGIIRKNMQSAKEMRQQPLNGPPGQISFRTVEVWLLRWVPMMNKTKYGCAAARNKGTYDNRQLIKQLEARVLNG
jgi:hypothetical protein